MTDALTLARETRKFTDDEIAQWNVDHPAGTWVQYWRGTRDGKSGVGQIRAALAQRLGSGDPVAWITGTTGGIFLTHIEKLKGCETFYGIQVTAIDDDEQLLVIGHHDDRRTVAALNAYTRKIHGLGCLFGDDRSNPGDYVTAAAGLDRTWAVFQDCDPGSEWYWSASWCSEYAVGAVPVTLWTA